MKPPFYVLFLYFLSIAFAQSQSTDLSTPAGSEKFGTQVVVLPNGNYVVTDPFFDDGTLINVGAVYLYHGSDHSLISVLKGSHNNDLIGNGGITLLTNGNFVISSTKWNDGSGAVTWANQMIGINGIISERNSLISSYPNKNLVHNITIFDNGNYLVSDYTWNNFTGAVSLGNGKDGLVGIVNASNSLIGTNEFDKVGQVITKLGNGKHIISSSNWNKNRGVVTLASNAVGMVGEANENNSLVGTDEGDAVGSKGITILPNNNYLVNSQLWNKRGAITFCNGESGVIGHISKKNSLVGTYENDAVGFYSTQILTNGNYLVRVPYWNSFQGAVVWGDANTGVSGEISLNNALTGNAPNQQLGTEPITLLSNGNYVVLCDKCNNGYTTVTWGDGLKGITGKVSIDNSFWPTNDGSFYSSLVTKLTNGNYVVTSPYWNKNRGAITWADGSKGLSGLVTSDNSLVGEREGDNLGGGGVFLTTTSLTNGNYVFGSEKWNNGAGAFTWANGNTGITGFINESNSLLGSKISPLGIGHPTALTNGNFVICFQQWSQGLGAVIWGNGNKPITGQISKENALIGNEEYYAIGQHGARALFNGNYVVVSYESNFNRGAVTWGNGFTGTVGTVSSQNSLVGSNWNDYVGRYFVNSWPDGSYHVSSPSWNNSKGAFTLGNPVTGISGVVSSENSLVGKNPNDKVGSGSQWFYSNGNYLIYGVNSNENTNSISWGSTGSPPTGLVSDTNSFLSRNGNENLGRDFINNPGLTTLSDGNYLIASADHNQKIETITFANSSSQLTGTISDCNSVTGTAIEGGPNLSYQYNDLYKYLVVGSPNDNRVTIFKPSNTPLASSKDEVTLSLNGTNDIHLISPASCNIITTLIPNGSNPVTGKVTAKTWIESSVPVYNGKPFVARHYQITPENNASSATSRITLYFSQQDFNSFNAHSGSVLDLPVNASDESGKNNLKISRYPGTSGDGSGLPASYSGSEITIDPANNDIIWNELSNRWEVSFNTTGFSGFTINTNSNPLPLTLLEFKGKLVETSASLIWKTTNEIGTSEFLIERSNDAKHFNSVGSIPASNTAGIQNYNFSDPNISALNSEHIYYRLKLIDKDGSFSYSGMIAISVPVNHVLLYPNPSKEVAYLNLNASKTEKIQLAIVDLNGILVRQKEHILISGDNTLSIEVKSLPTGIYFLQVSGETILERQKLVIE